MKKQQKINVQLRILVSMTILFLSSWHIVEAQYFEVVSMNPPATLRQAGCSNTFYAYCLDPNKSAASIGSIYYWDAASGTYLPLNYDGSQQPFGGGSPPPCVPTCTVSLNVTASPQTVGAGGAVKLTATATGTFNPNYISYKWSNGEIQNTATTTAYPATTTTYTVTATDLSARYFDCSATASVTVYVTQGTCNISFVTATPSACNSSTNTYSTSGYIYFSNPPSSGTLTVSDGTASQTLYPPFVSPMAYSLTGITANGSTHTVNASFSATNCSNSSNYTAPQSCSVVPSCSISSLTASPSACNSSTNTYSTSGSIYFSNPPSSGTLTVSDGTASQIFYAPFTSPLSYTLTGISANGSTHTVSASFSAASCSKTTNYTAPASCAVSSCTVSLTAIPGTCNPSTNTYSVSGRATLVNTPGGRIITFTDGVTSQSYTVPSSQVSTTWVDYTLSNFTSNGATHTVSAVVSNGSSCSGNTTYTAPTSCLCTNPTPTVNSPSICAGNSATLTVSNCAGTVTWSDGTSGATRMVSPSFTTTYTATCSVGTCTGTATSTVTVTSKPTPFPTVNNPSICAGSSATLTVSNCAGTVTWNDGLSGATRTVSPASTTSYIATCTVTSGSCTGTGTATGTVTVTTAANPTPTVNNPSICAGSSATLTVSNCAGTVTWNDGLSGATRTVSPASTTSYIATCTVTSGSCTGTGTATGIVTVNTQPTISINTSAITCSADLTTYSLSFTATIGATVTTDKGTITGTTVSGIPSGQTVTLTASLNGCSATASATKTCNCPSINAPIGEGKEYCEGDVIPALTVVVDAGLQADWYNVASGGSKLASGLSYSPLSAGDYYVEAVNMVSNCKSVTRTKVTLTKNFKPTILTQATCSANGLTYSVTVTSNAVSISADKGIVSGMMVTGISAGQTVNITAISDKNCKATTSITQNCTSTCITPNFNASGISATCNGASLNNDAKINIYNILNGDRVGYSVGLIYSGPDYASASLISGNTATITNLAGTVQNYTLRVFNGNSNCYNDVQVTIPTNNCSPNCSIDAGPDLLICSPKTTVDLKNAGLNEEWVVGSSNPVNATINAVTGEVIGMTTTGVYKFILRNTNILCTDEVQIALSNGTNPIILCNDGSTSYSLFAPSNLTNVIWYNMAGTQVGTGNILLVKSTTLGLEDGSEAYYYRGVDGNASGCDVELCCPFTFLTQVCCPTNNCIEIMTIKN